MTRRDVRALASLMDRERRLLLSGDLAALARLVPEKTRLAAALPSAGVDRETVEALSRSAHRNARLLAAALSGIQSAQLRLSAARDTPPNLETYDRGGRRQTLGGAGIRHDHKA
mgnify:CR=1 FL=1